MISINEEAINEPAEDDASVAEPAEDEAIDEHVDVVDGSTEDEKLPPEPENKLELVCLFFASLMVMAFFSVVAVVKFQTDVLWTALCFGLLWLAALSYLFLAPYINDALSRLSRAILCVALLPLLTSKLRGVILILLITWISQGPAMNLITNVRDTAEGVGCVKNRINSLAVELKDRADTNFRQVPIAKARDFIRENTKPLVDMRDTLRELDDSAIRMLALQRGLIKKVYGILANCSEVAKMPYQTCISMLNEVHGNCVNKFVEELCQPVHWLKRLCFLSQVLEIQCTWPHTIKNSIQDGADHFVKGTKNKVIDAAKQSFLYDVYGRLKGIDEWTSLDMAINHTYEYEEKWDHDFGLFHRELKDQFQLYVSIFNWINWLLELIIIPYALWPFASAVYYIQKLREDPSHDNRYITPGIEELDRARSSRGKAMVLPLSEELAEEFIFVNKKALQAKERAGIRIAFAIMAVKMLPSVAVILLDHYAYKFIKVSYNFLHGNATVLPKIPNYYKLKISGSGFLNEMLSNILDVFQPVATAGNRDNLWRDCFKEPTPPDYGLYLLVGILLGVCILLCILQQFAKRFKHWIALYFFAECADPRTEHLYKRLLKESDIYEEEPSPAKGEPKALRPGPVLDIDEYVDSSDYGESETEEEEIRDSNDGAAESEVGKEETPE